MPRKTGARPEAQAAKLALASMRPRPDAAENLERGVDGASMVSTLQ